MSGAQEAKRSWNGSSKEGDGDAEEEEAKVVEAPLPQNHSEEDDSDSEKGQVQNSERFQEIGIFPKVTRTSNVNGRQTRSRVAFDEAFEEIAYNLRRRDDLSDLARGELNKIGKLIEKMRSLTFRFDNDVFQQVTRSLERLETADTLGTTPFGRAFRSWGPRRLQRDPQQRAQGQADELHRIRIILKDVKKNAYEPSPHGDLLTVAAKKAVQAGKAAVACFGAVPGFPALAQALDALDTHFHSMANEGDNVADFRRKLRTLQGILSQLESTYTLQDLNPQRTIALQTVYDITLEANDDVEAWVALPKMSKFVRFHTNGGVSKAEDFEARMGMHRDNLSSALQILTLQVVAETHSNTRRMLETGTTTLKKVQENRGELDRLREIGSTTLERVTDTQMNTKAIRDGLGQVSQGLRMLNERHGLKEKGLQAQTEHLLQQQFCGSQPTKARKRHNLKPRSRVIGRDADIGRCLEHFEERGRMLAFSGIAGVGKSTCAMEVAWRFFEKNRGERFVWRLLAETEQSISQGYKDILATLNMKLDPKHDIATQRIASRVVEALNQAEESVEWLLVFDNVPDDGPDRFLEWFFPSLEGLGQGRILFTTRWNARGRSLCPDDGYVEHIRLDPFGREDGLKLLVQGQEASEEEAEAAAQLVSRFGGLPFALNLVQILSEELFGGPRKLTEYLLAYHDDSEAGQATNDELDRLLQQPFLLIENVDGRESMVWSLVSVLPCISPDRIPESFLKSCAGGNTSAYRRLVKLGILECVGATKTEKYYSIHRLLHESAGRSDFRDVQYAVRMMRRAMQDVDEADLASCHTMRDLINHVAMLHQTISIDGDESDIGHDVRLMFAAGVLQKSAAFLFETNDFANARQWAEGGLEILRANGGSLLDIAAFLVLCGKLEASRSAYESATSHFSKALSSVQRWHAGSPCWEAAEIFYLLGDVACDLGDAAEAQLRYQESLGIYDALRRGGINCPGMARTLTSLGYLKAAAEDYGMAEALYQQALEIYAALQDDRKPRMNAEVMALSQMEDVTDSAEKMKNKKSKNKRVFEQVAGRVAERVDYPAAGGEQRGEVLEVLERLRRGDLTEIKLEYCGLSGDGILDVATAMPKCPQLQTVDISYNNIGSAGAASFAEGMEACPQLQTVNISWNNIGDAGAASFADGMKACPQLQTVNISDNSIGEAGAASFAEGMKACPQLQTVDISGNRIGGAGAASFAEGVKACPQLQTVDISGNRIGDVGAASFAEGMKACPQLQTVNISWNNIGEAGAASFAEGMKACPQLQEAHIQLNSIGDAGAASFAEGMKACPQLQTVYIHANRIGEAGAASFAQGMKACPQLQEVSIGRNNIGDAGAASFAEGMKACPQLERVWISSNSIGDAGAASFAEGMKACPQLQEVWIHSNSIGDAGAASFAEGMKACPQLQTVYIWNNSVGVDGMKLLRKVAKEMGVRLMESSLSRNSI
eukprot:scaffold7357_cov195-Pinguiococcus_pyrenoidosus.AAC.14